MAEQTAFQIRPPSSLLKSAGSPAAMGELIEASDAKSRRLRRQEFEKHPLDAAKFGDVARHIEHNLTIGLGDYFGAEGLGEAISYRVIEMRKALGGDDCSEVERLLIDRVILTWLHLQRVEVARSRVWGSGDSFQRLDWYDKATGRAHREHIRAIEALARTRKAIVRIAQLNVAGPGATQTNVAALVGLAGSEGI